MDGGGGGGGGRPRDHLTAQGALLEEKRLSQTRTFVCLCFVLCCVVLCCVMFCYVLAAAARATYLPVPLRSGVPTPTAPPPPRGRVTDPSGHPIRLSIPPFDPAARPAVFPMDHIYVYIYIYIYIYIPR